MDCFRNRFNAKPPKPHENSGEYLVETMGVRTVEDEIRQIQLAGLKLRVYNSLVQYPNGMTTDNVDIHPFTDVGFDKLDASILEKTLLEQHKYKLQRQGIENTENLLRKQLEEVRQELASLKGAATSADTPPSVKLTLFSGVSVGAALLRV